MACPPVVIRVRESIIRLSELLLNTNHGGFPVVRKASIGEDVFFGSINRFQALLEGFLVNHLPCICLFCVVK